MYFRQIIIFTFPNMFYYRSWFPEEFCHRHISGWEWLLHTRIWISYFHSSSTFFLFFSYFCLKHSFFLKALVCCRGKKYEKRQYWVFPFESKQLIQVREELQQHVLSLLWAMDIATTNQLEYQHGVFSQRSLLSSF